MEVASSMFHIGLLLVLVITVTAELEYDDAVMKQLRYYEALADKAPVLDYTLKNSHAAVHWKRKVNPDKKEIRFVVATGNSDENGGETSSHTVGHHTTNPCEGRPFILATFQKDKNILLRFLWMFKRQPTAFCLHGLHISILKRKTQPRVRLIVRFRDPLENTTIGVEMDMFKPPKHQTGRDYTRTALQVDSPIPIEELNKPSLKSSEYDKHYFVGDISWMEQILPRARYFGYTKIGENQRHAEWYTAGPIIVQHEHFNRILRLEKDFESFAS